MKRIGIVEDELFALHDNGQGHPESPSRLEAVGRAIAAFGKTHEIAALEKRAATVEELATIHDRDYIATVERTAERDRTALDPETSANRHSYDAARFAAGSAVSAVRTLLEGAADSIFCATRPPGHHAEANRAMGFCIFNNAAVAARVALEAGAERVAIVDWDVHHGNGTMHSLYDENRILYLSLHQFPHYPGTGTVGEIGNGGGEGFTVNLPLSPGAGDADYLVCLEEIAAPIFSSWNPELLIISAGYDAHRRDPLASMNLTSEMYGTMTSRLVGALSPGTPVAVVLEGGYDLTALEEGVGRTLEALAGTFAGYEPSASASRGTRGMIDSLREAQRQYWPVLAEDGE